MYQIYVLPEMLFDKLTKSEKLHQYFSGNMTKSCYVHMMQDILQYIISMQEIPHKKLQHLQRIHAKMNISNDQFNEFINLFSECLSEIGITDKKQFHNALENLRSIIIIDDNIIKKNIIDKLDSILYDMNSSNDIYKIIIPELKQIQETIKNIPLE